LASEITARLKRSLAVQLFVSTPNTKL